MFFIVSLFIIVTLIFVWAAHVLPIAPETLLEVFYNVASLFLVFSRFVKGQGVCFFPIEIYSRNSVTCAPNPVPLNPQTREDHIIDIVLIEFH